MGPTFDFRDKVAFVSGAGTGIGRATALAFANAGAIVVAVGRTKAAIDETVALIGHEGGRAIALPADVAREGEVQAAIATTIRTFGSLDFAFNNAGIEQPGAAVADLSSSEWERQIGVNLTGVFYAMKHQLAQMVGQGHGAIVNTASGAGFRGVAGKAAYCAAKFGVIGLTKAAALDYAARNIRINALSPGIIETPMMTRFTGGTSDGRQAAVARQPNGRLGRPEEIAAQVLWLCSDWSAFTLGTNFVVDGGQAI
ncbi:SDR family oxidoreductase [Sphingomonas sp. AP4-R1]|uniref:SDR family oxidoreductase n=1 Tax=Sphingomonas sp. AP4-R1 TaxID=2735134 RepID=UPI0014933026|nr:SDR family oxidoreductase [Sphingomonas sp. AP4-R1]QJU58294.1 SDR family oxidoreductase [Sphingomonas sp. AP4-R1]